MSDREKEESKEYRPPKIIYAEKIEARAVTCALDSTTTGGCESGPVNS